jgi:Protein of unknown function (DUF3309)
MYTILLVLLILLLLRALPTWPYSRSWGYYPSSGLSLIILILSIDSASGGVNDQMRCLLAICPYIENRKRHLKPDFRSGYIRDLYPSGPRAWRS